LGPHDEKVNGVTVSKTGLLTVRTTAPVIAGAHLNESVAEPVFEMVIGFVVHKALGTALDALATA